MRRFSLALLLFSLSACSTAEQAADTTADTAGDVAEATADVATDVAGAVTDAAGAAYDAVADVFDDDGEAFAAALVRPTSAPGARAQGTVRFREADDGLTVVVSLRGLDAGQHGIHIHQNPACGRGDADGDGTMEPGGAAGGHWDPLGTGDHGGRSEDVDDKHLGDLGNVTARADGTAEATFTIGNHPADHYDVAGRSIVVHSGQDDLETDPSGDSGTRMACGVIAGRM